MSNEKHYQPSGISRAEQAALKCYPLKDYTKEPNYIHTCDTKMLDEVYRDVYQQGYEQAEKNLALKFKELREVQMLWRKTRVYGWRCRILALEKEVDTMIKEILGE